MADHFHVHIFALEEHEYSKFSDTGLQNLGK